MITCAVCGSTGCRRCEKLNKTLANSTKLKETNSKLNLIIMPTPTPPDGPYNTHTPAPVPNTDGLDTTQTPTGGSVPSSGPATAPPATTPPLTWIPQDCLAHVADDLELLIVRLRKLIG
jgi:hypothetical protein